VVVVLEDLQYVSLEDVDIGNYSKQELEDGARTLIGDTERYIVETLLKEGELRPKEFVHDGPTSEANVQMKRKDLEDAGIIETVKEGSKKSVDSLTDYGAAVVKFNNNDPRFEPIDIAEELEGESEENSLAQDKFFEPLKDAKAFARVGEYDKAKMVASLYYDWGFPEQEEVVDAYIQQMEK
jgi:hypothetical protein